jgi:hypothetical protein
MSEEIRLKKLAAAKKILKAFQHRNSPGVPAGAKKKKKKKIKNAGNPQSTTVSEDAPAPTAREAVSPASVPSLDTGLDSIEGLEYEVIPFINWEAITSKKEGLERDARKVWCEMSCP